MGHRRDRGFTLVELLVVIGIIAVLISILLPALSRARDQASRVRCLANMKQLHLASMEYASRNRDQIPIGYAQGLRQMNYNIWNSQAGGYQTYGLLWAAGIVRTPSLFYCPIRNDDSNAFNTYLNPWPKSARPGEAWPAAEMAGQPRTRASYSSRPEVNFHFSSYPPTGSLPKLSKFKNKALFADAVSDRDDVLQSHKNGTNVVYNDGHGVWVPKKIFEEDLKNALPNFDTAFNDMIWKVDSTTGKFTGVWANLDAGAYVGAPTPIGPGR